MKKFSDFIKKIVDFLSKLSQSNFVKRQIFENSIIHKSSLKTFEVPQKNGPDRFSRFDVYGIQSNRQTDKQSIYR